MADSSLDIIKKHIKDEGVAPASDSIDIVNKHLGATETPSEPVNFGTEAVNFEPITPEDVAFNERTKLAKQGEIGPLEPGERATLVRSDIAKRKMIQKLHRESEKSDVEIFRTALEPANQFLEKQFGNALKIIQKFQIPQQMVFNTLYRIQRGDVNVDSIVEGISNAMTGKEGHTSRQIWDKALDEFKDAGIIDPVIVGAIKDNPSYKALAFGSDILVDPLGPATEFGGLTSLGKLSKVKLAAKGVTGGIELESNAAKAIKAYYEGKTASEALSALPKLAVTKGAQAELGQRALVSFLGRPIFKGKAIYNAVDALKTVAGKNKYIHDLRDMLTTRTGVDAINDQLFKLRNLYNLAERQSVEEGVDIAKRLGKEDVGQVNLVSKVLDEGLDYEVTHDASKLGTILGGKTQVSKNVGQTIGDLRNEFQMMRDAETQMGILEGEINYYFPRSVSKKGAEYLEKTRQEVGDIVVHRFRPGVQFAKPRKTAEFTLDEVNEYMKNKTGLEEFFTKDPAVAYAIRKQGHLRGMARAETFQDIAQNFGVHEGGHEFEKKFAVPGIKELDGVRFDKDVAESVAKMYKVLHSQDQLSSFGRLFNQATDYWKAYTLGIFPAYHSRNMVSNLWNNFLAGVDNPTRYFKAGNILRGAEGSIETATGKKLAYDEIRTLARKYGVEGSGLYGAELPEKIYRIAKGENYESIAGGAKTLLQRPYTALNPTRANGALKLGFAVGKGIENNARMAHFIDRLIKGDTALEAAQSVAKYLFDYSDLTQFEKGLKRWLPFMKWTKQNIPVQVAALASKPWKFTAINKGREAAFEEGDVFHSPVPEMADFLRDNSPIRIRTLPDGKQEYWLLGGWWPAEDVKKMFHPFNTVVSLAHPAFGLADSALESYLQFKSPAAAREFEAEQKRPVQFLGKILSRGTVNKLRAIRVLNTGDQFMKSMKEAELESERDQNISAAHPLLRNLLGLRTYTINPAQDVRFKVSRDVDEARRQYKDMLRIKALEGMGK